MFGRTLTYMLMSGVWAADHSYMRVGVCVKLRGRTAATGTHLLLHQLQFGAAHTAAPPLRDAAGRRWRLFILWHFQSCPLLG